MSWEFLPAATSFAHCAADWDRLNGELYDGHPYFDSRFVGPLLKYFAKGSERLCLYHEAGVVRGAVILQPHGHGRWVIFRPAQAQISPILVADAALLQSLLKALPGFAWCIELHAVDPRYAPSFAPVWAETVVFAHAKTIGVVPESGFEAYWQQRPKNLRSNIRRYFNRLEREAVNTEFSWQRGQEAMVAGVARFGELESAGWKGEAGTAVSMDNVQGRFYAEVLTNFAAAGQAEICELSIGDQLAASRLLIGNECMLVILKTSYDEVLSRFAPGRLLLYRLLERELAEQPQRVVEFYTNATRDQAEWATFGSTVHSVQLFRSDSAIVAYTLFRTAKRQLLCSGRMRKPESATLPVDVRCCTRLDEFPEDKWPFGEFTLRGNLDTSIDWFALLQRQVYPDDAGVRYYYLADNGQAQAVLPLRWTRRGWLRILESLSNYYTSLYSPLLGRDSDPLALRHLLNTATRENRGAHMIRFAPMDPESPGYRVLMNELRAIGWIPMTFFCFGNWFLKVRGGWEDYLRQRSANLRSAMKRMNKKFAADGGTLELISDAAGVEAGIAAFEEVYSASWKEPEPYPDFVPSLIRLLATNGMLRLGIARLQGRPIAAQLWMAGQGKASIYKVAYHQAYAALSPGAVLTSYLLRHVIEQDQVSEVDFLIGDDEYKKTWMSHRRERWGIVAFNPRTLLGCALLAKEVAGRLTKAFTRRLSGAPAFLRGAQAVAPDTAQTNSCHIQREKKLAWSILPIDQFKEHAADWDALVRARPGTPFLESAFLKPLLAIFGSGHERLCLLRENGRLRAAAIMLCRGKAIWQTFQPSQLPLGAWITDGHVDSVAATDSLLRQLPCVSLALGVSQVDPRLQLRPGNTPTLRTQDYIATAWVDLDGTFDDYWEARGKNLKQNIYEQRDKLQAESIKTRLECITEVEQVAGAIEDYGMLESTGWKGGGGAAITPDNAQGRFYRAMLENYCAQGRGRIYRYYFGDRVVAMNLCIHDENVLIILRTAYDESYKSLSPSTLMHQEQFQQLFAEKKYRRIEFFGKVMEWHTRWTAQSRTIYHATSYRWAWLKALRDRRAAARAAIASTES